MWRLHAQMPMENSSLLNTGLLLISITLETKSLPSKTSVYPNQMYKLNCLLFFSWYVQIKIINWALIDMSISLKPKSWLSMLDFRKTLLGWALYIKQVVQYFKLWVGTVFGLRPLRDTNKFLTESLITNFHLFMINPIDGTSSFRISHVYRRRKLKDIQYIWTRHSANP